MASLVDAGTREAAFVQAISSASLAYAVVRSCSSGRLDRCGCDGTVKGRSANGFDWAGCSDNIAYGVAFAKTFVDAGVKTRVGRGRKAAKGLANLHNNNVGRKVVLVVVAFLSSFLLSI